jgi:hypothetical protein
MTRWLATVVSLGFLGGCYFGKKVEDHPWSGEAVRKIEPGKTTKAELLQILGAPREVVRLLDSDAYMYVHSIEKSTGVFLLLLNLQRVDKQFDAITVIINRQDIVTGIGHRFTAEEAEYGFPWD